MPRKQSKRQKVTSSGSLVRAGDRLVAALTHEEITQLLNLCFAVMPSALQTQVLQQLQPDTRQTVEQVLNPSQADDSDRPPVGAPVSIAKLAQEWSTMWQKWHRIIDAAAQEEGPYMAQGTGDCSKRPFSPLRDGDLLAKSSQLRPCTNIRPYANLMTLPSLYERSMASISVCRTTASLKSGASAVPDCIAVAKRV